ncbi:hypothetical protein [Massilia endophytica]|uniref:hypothetical protein n=1 Tax=Massilia endophytica TaxID=2899220 RepID=UPI001E393DEA|nr:hypothetical protein [Massilia endophytica]UGQ45899.1 hypothetical protein LSQ66_19235 [Massilia endophytica]
MNTPSDILTALREELASLRATSCRLVHERVVIDAHGIRRRGEEAENVPDIVRVGLCSKAVREGQLSCAHTRARSRLGRVIAESEREGALSAQEAVQLQADLARIDLAIHATDWEKNQAEVRYALLIEQGELAGSRKEQNLLDALVARHEELNAELGAMHRLLLERLDHSAR